MRQSSHIWPLGLPRTYSDVPLGFVKVSGQVQRKSVPTHELSNPCRRGQVALQQLPHPVVEALNSFGAE